MAVQLEAAGPFGEQSGRPLEISSRDTGRGSDLVEDDQVLLDRLGDLLDDRSPLASGDCSARSA